MSPITGVIPILFLCGAAICTAQKPCSPDKGKPGQCPTPIRVCLGIFFKFCANDCDCPEEQKCCIDGCHKFCAFPIQEEKPGTCPGRLDGQCAALKSCLYDEECPGIKKCCRTPCGLRCTAPTK